MKKIRTFATVILSIYFSNMCMAMENNEANNQATISNYLKTSTKPTLAIGEGKIYNNFGKEVLTADISAQAEPDIILDITNIDTLKDIPSLTFKEIHLCNLPTIVFDRKANIIFQEILRILDNDGVLIFNFMWGGHSANEMKELIINQNPNNELLVKMEAVELCEYLISIGVLNPFDDYLNDLDLNNFDFEGIKKYNIKLTNFFQGLGFTGTVEEARSDKGLNYSIKK